MAAARKTLRRTVRAESCVSDVGVTCIRLRIQNSISGFCAEPFRTRRLVPGLHHGQDDSPPGPLAPAFNGRGILQETLHQGRALVAMEG